MSEQIKPCPFCGKPAGVSEYTFGDSGSPVYRVQCEDGDAIDAWADSTERAIEIWNTRAPAPAQAREDEVLDYIDEVLKVHERRQHPIIFKDTLYATKEARRKLATLRSRQSPQVDDDATTCLACGQHNTAPGYLCPACGRPYLDHEHVADKLLDAAAPQPSPQGEDAEALNIIEQALTDAKEDDYGIPNKGALVALLEVKRLRARLASAQSSAQGEEPRESIGLLGEIMSYAQTWAQFPANLRERAEACIAPYDCGEKTPRGEEAREMREARPRIVCLCGSSRFIEEFAILSWTLERDLGVIVLGLHYLPPSYPGVVADHLAEAEGVAEKMDELHKRKIDLADEVLVLNVGCYIGSSTRSEIEYAEAHGKPVRYLETRAALERKEGK